MDKGMEKPFFEGVEKLLEIWFNGPAQADLRKIPRQKLESLLKLVHCEVISFTSNEFIDAYVLSESSMFVSQSRFILKTCGTTTPLQCVKFFMILVEKYSGMEGVEKVFYSRKNFRKPEIQQILYSDFQREINFLDNCFQSKGMGYRVRSKNEDDSWYLYALRAKSCRMEFLNEKPDQTLEILMTNLDQSAMAIFSKKKCFTAAEATKCSGIDKLIPSMDIDDFLFDPCGYSMNGIAPDGSYMTIHVTPEPDCSYVSFETNVPLASYQELMKRVLNAFKPGNFIVTMFANEKSPAKDYVMALKNLSYVEEWRQTTNVECDLMSNENLSVAFYSKFPS